MQICKLKDLENIAPYQFSLERVSKDFIVIKMKRVIMG